MEITLTDEQVDALVEAIYRQIDDDAGTLGDHIANAAYPTYGDDHEEWQAREDEDDAVALAMNLHRLIGALEALDPEEDEPEHPCGRCGKGEAAGAAGLCRDCDEEDEGAEKD